MIQLKTKEDWEMEGDTLSSIKRHNCMFVL